VKSWASSKLLWLRYCCVCTLLLIVLPVVAPAQYTVTSDGFRTVAIIGYDGPGGVVVLAGS
jgi:hypothetical protein